MKKKIIRYGSFLFVVITFIACRSSRDLTLKEVDANFDIKSRKNRYIEIYYNIIDSSKLSGVCSYSFSTYNRSAKYKATTFFQKGIKNGEEKEYRNDTLIKISNYVRGIKEGKHLEFVGSDSLVSYYKKGIQQGNEIRYINGKTVRIANYQNGLKEGEEKYFHSDGSQCATINYSFIPFKHQKDFDNYEVSRYLEKILERDSQTTEIEIIGFTHTLYTLAGFYKYMGNIKIGEDAGLVVDCRGYYHGAGISDAVSDSLWITLGDKSLTKHSYSGFFYTVDLFMSHGDYGVTEKWIVLVDEYSRIVQRVKIK